MGFEFSDPRAGRRGYPADKAKEEVEMMAKEEEQRSYPDLTPEQLARIDKILQGHPAPELRRQPPEVLPALSHRSPVINFQKLGIPDVEDGNGIPGHATAPTRAKQGDAGFDLYVSRSALVLVDGLTDLHTDIAIELPPGYFGRITGRSSTLRSHGLLVNEGIVDSGYRGELFVAVFNLGQTPMKIEAGQRVAQLLIHRIEPVDWREVNELAPSERGSRGFGSSGR